MGCSMPQSHKTPTNRLPNILTILFFIVSFEGMPARSAPFDLVPSTDSSGTALFDPNGLLFNPRWEVQSGTNAGILAHVCSALGIGGNHEWNPPCTSQATWLDMQSFG